MADQTPVMAEAFDRLNREFLAVTILARDREQVLGMVNFLREDMQSMRAFRVGESEPATTFDPAAER